jgi:hypothetical protein
MSELDTLIRENEELKARLKNCQTWMLRQVAEARLQIERAKVRVSGRHYFVSNFETEVVDNIDEMIRIYFSDTLKNAPKFTLERLHDAEIYWNTLQKFSHIDALSIVLSYQKILDSYFERITNIFHSNKKHTFHTYEISWIDHDILQVIDKKYSLSLGRWYQLISLVREERITHPILQFFVSEIDRSYPWCIQHISSDAIFFPLERLIQGEYFSYKRHATKVSFVDARDIREICTATYKSWESSLFLALFQYPIW